MDPTTRTTATTGPYIPTSSYAPTTRNNTAYTTAPTVQAAPVRNASPSGMPDMGMNINSPKRDSVLAMPGMKKSSTDRKPSLLPGAGAPGQAGPMRRHLIAFLGEFVGTFLFLFLAFAGTQVANNLPGATNASKLMYIALAFGFSLAVTAWVFFRITGGMFNPAVTLGLALIGCLGWLRALVVFVAQIVGAIAAAGLVSGLFPGPLSVTTTLSRGTSIERGLFIEMFLTAFLVFTIFMLAAEKHRGTFLAPVGVGLALFVCELAGVAFTGGSLNPARSFGPAVVRPGFPGYHWIYWVGPFLGTLLAVLFYRFIKALEYETYGAVDQDSDHPANPAAGGNIRSSSSRDPFTTGPMTEASRATR